MSRAAAALTLLLVAACVPEETLREVPAAPVSPREAREPPTGPCGLGAAGALGYMILFYDSEGLDDGAILDAWRLVMRDPAGPTACAELAEYADTFRGRGVALLGLVGDDPAVVRERLGEMLGPLPAESPRETDSGASGADEPPLGDLCETLSPAGRLALLALEETPGHVLRPGPGSLGPAALGVLLAEPRARDLLRALADEGPTVAARVAGLLGLLVLDPDAGRAATARLLEESAEAPHAAAALAAQILESSSRFMGSAVGEGGETPASCWAFRVLVSEPDAAERFGDLADTDDPVPRLYAACGLRLVDEPASRPLLAKLGAEGGTVPTLFGCIRSSDSVADLVAEIESGALPRDLAGR